MELPIAVVAMCRPTELASICDALTKLRAPKFLVVDKYEGENHVKRALNEQVHDFASQLTGAEWNVFVNRTALGCKRTVEAAVTRATSAYDGAIIIEDDLIFDDSFYDFFQQAMDYGATHLDGHFFVNGCNFSSVRSAHLTTFFHGWGWGVSKKLWHAYLDARRTLHWDFRDLTTRGGANGRSLEMLATLEAMAPLARAGDAPADHGGIDTWDYQFSYYCLLERIHGIAPAESIFANVGFNSLATHTVAGTSPQRATHPFTGTLHELPFGHDAEDITSLGRTRKCRFCSGAVTPTEVIACDLGFPLLFSTCEGCGLLQVVDTNWLSVAYSSGLDRYDQGAVIRSLRCASLICELIANIDWGAPSALSSLRVLDYGAGSGLMARLLRDAGYDCRSYDKYSPAKLNDGFHNNHVPPGRFNIVSMIEVAEHIADFQELFGHLRDLSPDLLVVSTELHNGEDSSWMYFAPFHGQHVSIFSSRTVQVFAKKLGLQVYMCTKAIQILGRPGIVFRAATLQTSLNAIFRRLEKNGYAYASRDHATLRTQSLPGGGALEH